MTSKDPPRAGMRLHLNKVICFSSIESGGRLKSLVIFLILSMNSWSLMAAEKNSVMKENQRVSPELNMSEIGTSMLSYLPGDLSTAVKTYLEVMQPSLYNQSSISSVGFANTGLEKSLSQALSDSCGKKLLSKFLDDDELKGHNSKISILEDGSVLKSKGLEPGWVWKKALSVSEGNPNLAVALIGACGHDDSFRSSSAECPGKFDNFYLPKGLGKEVDISDDLRDYVIQTQSIDANPHLISGKNYHIYGSAYLGCRMLENGVSPEKIGDYAQKFAYIYRKIRVCKTARATVDSLRFQQDIYELDLEHYNKDPDHFKKPIFAEFNSQKEIDHYYAAKLYLDTMACPTSVVGEKVEALKAMNLEDDVRNENFVFGRDQVQFDKKCRAIAEQHCEGAKKVLLTWDADFKWTMAQHRAGAEFAAQHCKPVTTGSPAMIRPAVCK